VAKYRLAYEELFKINYKAISSKYEKFRSSAGKSVAIPMDVDLIKEILGKLPFDLTNHQKIALFQILKDMEKPHAMQRLLEGDVGTGKTVVALIAVIHSIKKTSSSSEKTAIHSSLSKTAPPSPPLEGGISSDYSIRK
jgi:ATP-dependent DNA helicase RecG